MPPPGFDDLSDQEKELYIDALRARVRRTKVPESHLAEIRRRLAADAESPQERVPWRDAISELRTEMAGRRE